MKNIVIIMGDQHRCDCIGAYGNRDIQTPNLDKLAEDGVLYQEHYTTYPVCTPSRYSMLSGLYTHQHMGWDNHCTLPAGLPTYPRIFSAHGYRTAAIGKMHMTPVYLDVGFQKMVLAEQDGDGRFEDDYHWYLKEKNELDENDIIDQRQEFRKLAGKEYWDSFGASGSNLSGQDHSTSWITDRALEELGEWGPEKNMMLVSYIKPHHPFDPPAPYDTMYQPENLELLPGYTENVPEVDYEHSHGYFDHRDLDRRRLKKVMACYYGSITHMDYHIGRIIHALKDMGVYDDTLILYTSDHGDYMGYHHMLLKANYMYDPLVKIPLIVKFPGGKHHGKVNTNLCNHLDIAPMLLHQAGIAVPDEMKGLDIGCQSAGREMTLCEGLRVDHYGEEKKQYYEYMVRSRRYKLIINKNLHSCRFFDLEKDPFELHDVAGQKEYSRELERHRDYLFQTLVFDAPSPVYLNGQERLSEEGAKRDSKRKTLMQEYCRTRYLLRKKT